MLRCKAGELLPGNVGHWLRRVAGWTARAALATAGVFAVVVVFELARLPDVDALLERVTYSTVLLDRHRQEIRYAHNADGRLAPRTPLERIHPAVVAATIAAEDARFRSHRGVDVLAVLRALRSNVTQGRIVSGASTITMQVARLLRPLERSYFSKLREALLALRLESVLSKDQILELYLNLSPYGGNTRGVEAAARRYFGRAAHDLSLSEAVLLAGLPQSPSRLRPDRHPEEARVRRNWILARMVTLGMLVGDRAAEVRGAKIRAGWHALPFSAPHFGGWVLERVAPGSQVRTTLDPVLQSLAEETVHVRLRELADPGVRSGAALIVEVADGSVRALVGSQDFFAAGDGQVNGATALRSPGSLLKPFLYGLAFERGIATPETLLEDSPRCFRDGYEPQNFTRRFAGRVTAREALVRSLNVPAVDILARVGVSAALERLRAFGFRGLRKSPDHYGLALGLGGVEVTLLEVAEAYATLARLGRHRRLTFREPDEDGATAPAISAIRANCGTTRKPQVLDAAAAYQVADVLEGAGWSASARDGGLRLPRTAMKTGTSFGLRDAWAVAYTPRWTVAVWFGNFDAEPSSALVGRRAAVPAVTRLMRRLDDEARDAWFEAPPSVRARSPDGPHSLVPKETLAWSTPPDGATYVVHERPGGTHLDLHATTPAAGKLSFFVDGGYLGQCRSGEKLRWPLRRGTHRVTLVSADGESETRTVRVE